MSRREKKVLEAVRKQLNTLSWAVAFPTTSLCQLRLDTPGIESGPYVLTIREDGGVFKERDSKSIKDRLCIKDMDAHERINALCEELGYTVECEPERYVVRKKKKEQTNK